MRPLMKLALAIAVAFLVPAALFAQPFDVEVVNGKEAVAKEALVRFRPGGASALPRLAAAANALEANLIGSGDSGRIKSQNMNIVALMRLLRFDPDVELVEPNYILRTTVDPNDYYFGLLWGLKNYGQDIVGQIGTSGVDIQASTAWDMTTGSKAFVVGVVDTGIAYAHPDLAGNVWSASKAFSVNIGGIIINCAAGTHGFNAIRKTCDPNDDNDHGSHVSGTIGAVGNNGVGVTGVNWIASIMGLKFLGRTGSGSTSDAINAIEFAIQVKQQGLAMVHVLNNSWGGGGYSDLLKQKIEQANANGMLFVASAGNNGVNTDATPSYPAGYDVANVISVAATDNKDELASFSNYGETTVDLGAPGVNIASTVRSGYAWMSGTSMAAPHVSGVAALVLAKCPDITTAQLKSNLLGTVDPVQALVGKTVKGGRLNAYNALNACEGTPPPPPAPGSFSITIQPPDATVKRGSSVEYIVTVASEDGFAGAVNLSVSNLPLKATGTFEPPSVSVSANSSATSKLTVETATKTKVGTRVFTVTGTSGSLVATATATITVN